MKLYASLLDYGVKLVNFTIGYIKVDGGSSSKGGGGGGLISIEYATGYVTGELAAYGGSGGVESGAAGIIYIKHAELSKKVCLFCLI